MNPAHSRRRRPLVACAWWFALLLGPLAAKDAPPPGKTHELPAMKIKGEVRCSFGMGLQIIRKPSSLELVRLVIREIESDSTAAKSGLKPGDEIIAINHEKVPGMTGGFKRGERLFDLLLNRPAGETISVEIRESGTKRVRRVTLVSIVPIPL